MKQYASLVLCLVLTAALLVGCGCTNQKQDNANTSVPTVLPTNEEVWDTTNNTTTPPTTHSNAATEPSSTIDRGNGALEDNGTGEMGGNNGTGGTNGAGGSGSNGTTETNSTTPTDGTAAGRSRQSMPSGK